MDIDLSYVLSKTPLNRELAERLQLAVNSLFSDMRYVNPSELDISEFTQRYLKQYLQTLHGALQRYAWILGGALSRPRKPLANIVFIEYGGGTGFLSLLAKRLGIGTVIYNDIYDVSCRDAEKIAQALECSADYYVQGDIDDLVAFCNKHNIKCDSMGSNDVLEHIYDIDDFLSKLCLLSHEGTTMVHATANMFFYPYVKQISKKQKEVETRDRQRQWGHKERDCLLAYQNERKKIIKSYMPNLGDDEIERLAKATRGLMHEDIVKVVDGYVQSNKFPSLIEHPTNTCDPHTGNWMEHLMNPYYLVETLASKGFDAEVLFLPWQEVQGGSIKKAVAKSLNFVIRISNAPLYFSGSCAICAQYSGSFSHQTHKHHIYKCRRSFLWWYSMLPLWQLLYGLYDLNSRITRTG